MLQAILSYSERCKQRPLEFGHRQSAAFSGLFSLGTFPGLKAWAVLDKRGRCAI